MEVSGESDKAQLVLIVDYGVRTQVFHDGVEFNIKPPLKHSKIPVLGPCRLVSVPPIQFALENLCVYLFEDGPCLVVILVFGYQINRSFILRIPRCQTSCRL